MLSFEEARKQRQKKVQSLSGPASFEDARANRSEESRNRRRSFVEASPVATPTISTDPESSATKAFGRSAAVNTLPMVGGLALGVKTGAAGSVFGPVGTVAGFIGGGIVGSIITKMAQDKVLEVTKGEEWKRNLDQSIAEDRQNHPFATLAGEAAPQLIAFRPSASTLKQAYKLSGRILTDPKSLAKHTQTLEGKVELDALMNVGIGAGIDMSLETYQQAREGDFNALRIIASGVIGGTLSNPNRIGVKMGFKPTGDAVIEEYNKFGSKTEAADIITKGKIPMLNRGVDSVIQDRMELASILKGEREQSRFDNPRIVQAERISGTIDKDVTADSDINVYRLDGRSGPLRVGERVTANPHIADVYGGRVNPETTLKAGDLVRTSRGDYVYVPKGEIQARPKLPPVATTVPKPVRKKIILKEKSNAKEALRIKEEPARLAKEARDKAEAQQKASDALVAKQEAAAVKQTADLETKVKTIQAGGVAKVQAEADRVASEKVRISKEIEEVTNKVKAIQSKRASDVEAETKRVASEKKRIEKESAAITKQQNKDLDEARLENVRRKEVNKKKKATPTQVAKEQIRFKNLNARIRAKAIADKKKLNSQLVDNTAEIKRQSVKDVIDAKKLAPSKESRVVTDTTKDIERQNRKDVIEAKNQGKLDKADQAIKDQAEFDTLEVPVKKKAGARTEKAKAEPKSEGTKSEESKAEGAKSESKAETRTTLIGTKRVQSESLIKNAIQDARDTSNKAQELDQDVTFQQGTTFVEQRKLSAELLAEKGFDESILFARQATDAELNKLGIARSALYEVLYKTVIREGQFDKFRDELESLALLVADEVSEAAQKSSIHRLATQNDPFRRVAALKKAILEKEKQVSGSVFTKEVDELYAKIKNAGTEEDINKIINDNLC